VTGNSEEQPEQVSASFDKAEGEVDWFSEVVEECGEASDDEWNLMKRQQRTTGICHGCPTSHTNRYSHEPLPNWSREVGSRHAR